VWRRAVAFNIQAAGDIGQSDFGGCFACMNTLEWMPISAFALAVCDLHQRWAGGSVGLSGSPPHPFNDRYSQAARSAAGLCVQARLAVLLWLAPWRDLLAPHSYMKVGGLIETLHSAIRKRSTSVMPGATLNT